MPDRKGRLTTERHRAAAVSTSEQKGGAALATELEELEVRTSVSMLPWPASPLASSGILTMTGPVRRRPGLRLHRPRAAEAAAAGGDSSGDMDVEGAEVEGAAQPAKRLTWAQLEAAVQCSSGAAELQAALLQRARALEVGGGRWCILEAQYAQDVCGSLLDLLVEKEWPLDALPLGEAVEAIRKL